MAKYPVVVYGASGYTGMLIMDWLIDQQIPFTAVARNAERVQEMMAQRVVRLEIATYEIVETEHTVEALDEGVQGRQGRVQHRRPVRELRPDRGRGSAQGRLPLHRHDRRAELHPRRARPVRRVVRQAGLLVSPSTAYMYTFAEIAAELALETDGIDVLETATLCRGPRFAASGVTVGSTASIFELFRSEQCYLWEKKLVPHAVGTTANVVDPSFVQPVFSHALGRHVAAGLLEHDARVRCCSSYVGFYDNNVMQLVHGLGQKWEAEYKNLPREHQDAVIKQIVDSTTPSMPPRERTTMARTVDFAIGRGQLARGARHGARHHALHLHGRAADRGRHEAARRRDRQGRLRVGLQGLRSPLPARLPRAARPGAGHRHAALSRGDHGHHRLLRPRLAHQPHGRRLHPGRPSATASTRSASCRAASPTACSRSASPRRPRARSGRPTT